MENTFVEVERLKSELQERLDDLEDQIQYVEDAINALNVYEHIPSTGEVTNG